MENEIMYIKLDDIIPNRFQPREVFDEDALGKLADSIRQHGVIEPILVRPVSNKYEIIAGERRYKASVLAGLTNIPAIVRQMDDKESSIVAYIENEHRSDVSAIEEARTIDRILKSNDMTQEELAKELGINQSTLANKLRLLSLPIEVQNSLMHNEISERHARSLLSVKDEIKQIELLNKIKQNKMTVRELDSEIKSMNDELPSNNQPMDYLNNIETNNSFIPNESPAPSETNNSFIDIPGISPMNEEINSNTFLDISTETPSVTEKVNSNSFLNTPLEESIPPMGEEANTNTFLDIATNGSIPPMNENIDNYNIKPNEEPKEDNFMDFLNNYDNNNPQQENTDVGFMSYLNNYDNNSPLPTMEQEESTGKLDINEYLNNNEYNHEDSNTLENNNYEEVNAPIENDNLMINDVNPPITTPYDPNSYVEDNSNYFDVSKEEKINNVDEIINRLKVVVDDIKEKSIFKVDTEEINFDDIYQITIKIDKRDF